MKIITPSIFALLTAVFALLWTPATAQLNMTLDQLVENFGEDYKRVDLEDETFYILYTMEAETETSGKHERATLYSFEMVNDNMRCTLWRIMEPLSEINDNIKMLNKKYVKNGKLEWKDYRYDIIYAIHRDENLCSISVYFDDASE